MQVESRELLLALSEMQAIARGEAVELRAILVQILRVLAQAADSLRGCFLDMDRQIQQCSLHQASAGAAEGSPPRSSASAIMSLQFEDIVRQQLEYAVSRLSALEQLGGGVEALCRELWPSEEMQRPAAEVVEQLARGIARGVVVWVEERTRRSTKQDSLDGGTSELF